MRTLLVGWTCHRDEVQQQSDEHTVLRSPESGIERVCQVCSVYNFCFLSVLLPLGLVVEQRVQVLLCFCVCDLGKIRLKLQVRWAWREREIA